jgi:hypothetical protein
MIKAAEDLKQQQLKREQERQSVLSSRVKPLPDVDAIDDKGDCFVSYQEFNVFQPSSKPSTTSSSSAWSNSKRRNT